MIIKCGEINIDIDDTDPDQPVIIEQNEQVIVIHDLVDLILKLQKAESEQTRLAFEG